DADIARDLEALGPPARKLLGQRTVWNINSTARGGGVAEMLQSLIGYARLLGVAARWIVIDGDPPFFAITKRLHNNLHGHHGAALGPPARAHSEPTPPPTAPALPRLIRPGDIVICHDPQTAGLVPALKSHGAIVLWRCHVGRDTQNDLMRRAWDFLTPYLRTA